MNYDEAIRYAYALENRGIKLGIDRLGEALERFGSPEKKLRVVHVAGTNGKGSVSAMVESMLRAGGVRTGLFTSPHLHRFVERIQIGGRPLGKALLARLVTRIDRTLAAEPAIHLSFFELSFAIALLAFVERKVEVAVVEVGLGGRLDATNVVHPLVSVITRVAKDHTKILGTTLPAIAKEKAGIIKGGVPVITGVDHPAAQKVIEARAKALRAPLWQLGRDIHIEPGQGDRFSVRVGKASWTDLRSGLAGAHQRSNAALAIAAVHALRKKGPALGDAAIRRGLARVRWPARLEALDGDPPVLIDGAHNPDGIRALRAHLATLGHRAPKVLLFGAMADKEYPTMLRTLGPCFDAVIYPPFRTPRAAAPADLAKVLPGTTTKSIRDALRRARQRAGRHGLIVITGSLLLVAEARATVLGLETDPPIRM